MNRDTNGFDITVKRLKLDNFRGFINLDLEFKERITVLIAENGGGKTTILDAIAQNLNVFLSTLLDKNFKDSSTLNRKDIKNGTISSASSNLEAIVTYPVIETEDTEYELDGEIKIDKKVVDISQFSQSHKFGFEIKKSSIAANVDGYSTEEDIGFKTAFKDFKEENEYLPVLAFYGGNGINTIANTTDDIREDKLYHLYHQALSPERFSFQSFLRWFDTEYKTFHLSKNENEESLTLMLIARCVETILNEDMENKVFKDLRMEYTLSGDAMVIDKLNTEGEYEKIEVGQMSAGEKMLFAMSADLVKRFILANPIHYELVYNEPKPSNPLEGGGVVLIDEIDLHLHPKWQRRVLVKLGELFPNTQFIVTTHSPFVLQTLKPEQISLFELSNFQVYSFENAFHYGRDANAIAYSLQGVSTRIPEIEVEIKKMYDLIDKSNYEEAKLKVKELSKYLSEFDEDIIKARTFIEFYSND